MTARPAALAVLSVLMLGGLYTGSSAWAAAPQVGRQAPGFYRMMLGRFEITALLDGTHPFPVASVLQRPRADGLRGLLAEVRPGEAEALLARQALSLPLEGSINAFLVNTGARLVLVDTGAGALYGACCGRLLANLRAAGYAPEDVDDVLLTHLHVDHVGGVAAQGKAAFPNAVLHVARGDAEYWTNPDGESTAPAQLRPMFAAARAGLAPYAAAGRLATFAGEDEVVPGIRPVPTPGHTPGHTSYRATSEGETMLIWGDIVHVAPIQFPDPAVTTTYDSDAASAEARRDALLTDAARTGSWIAAAHISFPGLGHVRAEDGRFTWIPANYTTALPASGR